MSDLFVNINSTERRTILTDGADLSMKNLPISLVFTYQSCVGSDYLPFVFSIKVKGLYKREVTEKCTTQLAATGNWHDSQFICS